MNKFLLLIALALIGCSQMKADFMGNQNNSDENFVIQQVPNGKSNFWAEGGEVKITYTSYSELIDQANREISNKMLNEKEAAKLTSSIPKGGKIFIHIFRLTIERASMNSFTFLLKKNGNEILRYNGKNNIHNVPRAPYQTNSKGNTWSNTEIIDLDFEFNKQDTIELFVMDNIDQLRDEFTIKHK